MKIILYYLEFSQELFQQQCNKKVNNLLLQITIDEKLKSNIDSHRLLFVAKDYSPSYYIVVETILG